MSDLAREWFEGRHGPSIIGYSPRSVDKCWLESRLRGMEDDAARATGTGKLGVILWELDGTRDIVSFHGLAESWSRARAVCIRRARELVDERYRHATGGER